MENKYVHTEVKGQILIIKIARPEKLNALNFETLGELKQILKILQDNPTIKAAIITGEGNKAFVAGADISEIAKLNEINGRKASETGQEIFSMIENSSKVIVAAINGYALGGGCELALACHLRLASENAVFGQPEINIGIIPGYGATQRLPQIVGKGRALQLMLTGENITAHDALAYGLVNQVVPQDQLMSEALALVQKIIEKPAISVSSIIYCVNSAYDKQENGYQTEANQFANCLSTDDFKEGTMAFFEKRKPNFNGK